MIVKSIKLNNFRCHKDYFLRFNKKTTMIIGGNGCGKTSVLEAIYLGCQGKSFRAVDKEILSYDESFYRAELEFFDGEKVIVSFDRENNKKTFIIQDKKTARLAKKNKYPVVLFEPSDLNLVQTSPTKRRNYFDKSFSQFSETYYDAVLKYERALKQRNELLKQEFTSSDTVFSWNVMLAKYGMLISKMRKKMIDEINFAITEIYWSIAENDDQIEIRYKVDGFNNENDYLKRLDEGFQRDKILGHTSFGIHRDDYEFIFNNSMADGTASRGEIRSMILAMKFIEAKSLEEKLGKKPLILLDDVFSELDEKRQKCLVKNFKNNQVVITSVKDI